MTNLLQLIERELRRRRAVAALIVVALIGHPAQAKAVDEEEKGRDSHPGHVDGSIFAELADPNDSLVEVTLGPPMLKVLRNAYAGQVGDVAGLLGQVHSIEAVVAKIGKNNVERAEDEIKRLTQKLEDEGWDRVARVREGNDNILVYALPDEDVINGLVVFVVEGGHGDGGKQIVFANIAGRVDLGKMVHLQSGLGIPGLKYVPMAIEREKKAEDDKKSDSSAK